MTECRFDVGTIAKFRETPQGFLDLYITFSKVGDLVYRRADGSFITETLTAEELFKEDSISTLTGKPITEGHPPAFVTTDNYKEYTKGSTGTKILIDGDFATIVGTVYDAGTITKIKKGDARQVSVGYNVTVVNRDGKLYQTDRDYNHLAVLTTEGRAGDSVRVHYHDSASTIVPTTSTPLQLEDTMPTKKATSPAVEAEQVEGEEQPAEDMKEKNAGFDSLTEIKATLSSLVTSLNDMKSALHPAPPKENSDSVPTVETEIKASFDSGFSAGFERHALEQTAVKHLGVAFKFDGLSNDEIKTKVVTKLNSAIAPKLDSASTDYISAAYDLALSNATQEANNDSISSINKATTPAPTPAKEQKADELAYAEYRKRLTNRGQQK